MSEELSVSPKDRPARWAVRLAVGSAVFTGVVIVLLILTYI